MRVVPPTYAFPLVYLNLSLYMHTYIYVQPFCKIFANMKIYLAKNRSANRDSVLVIFSLLCYFRCCSYS
jgi:hypothetical protein